MISLPWMRLFLKKILAVLRDRRGPVNKLDLQTRAVRAGGPRKKTGTRDILPTTYYFLHYYRYKFTGTRSVYKVYLFLEGLSKRGILFSYLSASDFSLLLGVVCSV